ncbi:MAG: hypothetical protein L0L52_01150 [Staphylococcus equorum]|uniref:Uncharacterized protein n=1 Tax=Staphylococcus equorum TaxID=246432 RepID=A0A9X4L7Z4_9STAP|nr:MULTISPECIES: hypothetical protein [Staphylococcus]KRG09889.1 hypothetical protein ACA31_03155 [Staphylococcus sp. NAM3COL9]MDG0821334.1 hypothetical protein [Staphylococcus equorum]MDG0843369.1 hypothetical protein [Staphylococcus equorum]MDG0858680.1 hypothetical protein [Staphylococcus equorum]MDK9869945.1 hypothetical protein [Staphylococcus equorum]
MTDLFIEIHNALLDDPVISKHFRNGDIEFLIHPNANDISQNVIVIDEVFSPVMSDFADDNPLTYEYLLQIDVFVKQQNNQVNGSLLSRELILCVSKIMWEQFGFGEFNSFKPEYYPDFKLYQTSKQYRGKKYINKGYL